jgi:hypothetical protein
MVESKFFEKCTFGAAPHGVKSLPPSDTAAGAWFRHQGGAARRLVLAQHDGRPVSPCHTTARSFLFFYFFIFKKFLTFLKTTN